MSRPRSDFVRELVERGFVHQATDLEAIDALAAEGRLTAYIGFDCTADSLHVGNLVSIMMLRWLQRTGHRPIALIGGGTSKVGDPSGKDESRQLLDDATLAVNRAGIRRSLEGFLEFGDGPDQALLVDNADWLDELRYIPFLRAYGRHFTINRMLTFDSVKLRLEREQPLTFLEFNYMVMQAYDFLELARRHDCRLQMGGSDQWGNIVDGVELGRRAEGLELFGLTTPLITTSSGAKMGKTAQGAVWLNEDRLSALRLLAVLAQRRRRRRRPVSPAVHRAAAARDRAPGEARGGRAERGQESSWPIEATRLCRGEAAATAAAEAARAVFEPKTWQCGRGIGQLPTTDDRSRGSWAKASRWSSCSGGSGSVPSNSEARRLIRGGGARLNERKVEDEAMTVGLADLVDGQLLLSAGRKRHVRVRAI